MTKLFLKALASLVLLFCFFAEAQAEPIAAFTITYTLGNNYITAGTAEFTLRGDEEQGYQLVLQTNPKGLFSFSDKGKIRETAELASASPPFLSSNYAYTNFGKKSRSYESVYDRENNEATTVRAGVTETFAIETDAVDRLSMTLAVMNKLHEEPGIKNFSIKMLEQSGARSIDFVSKGQETIKTPIGKLEATRVDRQRINSNRNTVTWFAAIGPGNLPIPVQIEQYKNGKMSVRLKVTAFSVIE